MTDETDISARISALEAVVTILMGHVWQPGHFEGVLRNAGTGLDAQSSAALTHLTERGVKISRDVAAGRTAAREPGSENLPTQAEGVAIA